MNRSRTSPQSARWLRALLGAASVLMVCPCFATVAAHRCAGDALQRAPKLLALHTNPEQPSEITKVVTVLPSLRNPANRAQEFDVLAISGYVYKAEYRMRFLYARIPGPCILVGQEILEHSSI